MKQIKKLYARLIYKFIISKLKKGVKDELFHRLLVHYTLSSMIEIDIDEITITYEHEDFSHNLEIVAKLVEGGER